MASRFVGRYGVAGWLGTSEVFGEILLQELAGARGDEVLQVELFQTFLVFVSQSLVSVDPRKVVAWLPSAGNQHPFRIPRFSPGGLSGSC